MLNDKKEKCAECGQYVENLGFNLECEYCLSKKEE
jgi:DNA-directed RNA polymerase subunit RPC12/RpoP